MSDSCTSRDSQQERGNVPATLSNLRKYPLSVVVLTKNEELFIERCIQSVRWADECVVLDSGSTDRTREIATSLGANVHEQEWLGWVTQRTKAISLAKHDWIFVLEADEIVTPKLAHSKSDESTERRSRRLLIDKRDEQVEVESAFKFFTVH